MLITLLVLKDTGPGNPESSRQLPAHGRVVEPNADEVADGTVGIGKRLTTVQNGHIIDEAKIPTNHARLELMLASDEVDSVEGFSLGFCEAGNVRAARFKRGVTDKKASGEGHHNPAVVVEEERAGVEPGVAQEAEAGLVVSTHSVAGGTDSVLGFIRDLRVKRPVGRGQHVDQVGASGCELVVDGPRGGDDALASFFSQTLGEEAQAVRDGVGVERLGRYENIQINFVPGDGREGRGWGCLDRNCLPCPRYRPPPHLS